MSAFNRRSFLKSLPAGAGLLAFSCSREKPEKKPVRPKTGDPLYDAFMSPQAKSRPFYRWWWNDNRVTEEEIRREIQLMAESGAGGVEINPIALPDFYKDLSGKPLEWLSKEWNRMIKVAVEEAESHDMIVDLIVGTGWPFGGHFLNNDETIQGIELEIQQFEGPQTAVIDLDFPADEDHKLLQLMLFPEKIDNFNQRIDLTSQVDRSHHVEFQVPKGKWQLYILTWRNKFRDVMYGARGAAGPVLDHFDDNAVRKYLDRMSDALNPVFSGSMGKGLSSMFCDSIELEGANWTDNLLVIFRKRRGYNILPYISLVLNTKAELSDDLAETIKRVRYDFSKTLAELFMERFILPYHNWCHLNGTTSRYQAYGYPWIYTDLLDGYLVPDIPESDQWLFNSGWMHRVAIDDIRYATWNKYASSGGHLTGRPVISCEAMTNTRGVFEATLEYIKQATDLNFAGGINRFVLHGFNYSPPEAQFPGWIRFGTYFNENNPWWPFIKYWSDYCARLCQIFQESQPVADVAILGPTPDVWREHGLDRNPWITTPGYLHELWQALSHNGYVADYVNASILQNASFENGRLNYGPMSYQILICADVKSLHPLTAQALLNFAENGGKILFINEQPFRSPGLADHETNDLVVKESIRAIIAEHQERVKVKRYRMRQNLTDWIAKTMQEFGISPSVSIDETDERLFVIRHKHKDRDLFFMCNSNKDKSIQFRATFPVAGKTAWEWNAETGERRVVETPTPHQLHVKLFPLEAKLLVFEPRAREKATPQPEVDEDNFISIQGPWKVTFSPVRGDTFDKTMLSLQNWANDNNLKTFSGTAEYATRFVVEDVENAVLDLGEVHDIAEAFLNGTALGVRWWGQKRFLVTGQLEKGPNDLRIRVTNTLFNYCRSLKDNVIAQQWISRSDREELMPGGLIGPVRLLKIK